MLKEYQLIQQELNDEADSSDENAEFRALSHEVASHFKDSRIGTNARPVGLLHQYIEAKMAK